MYVHKPPRISLITLIPASTKDEVCKLSKLKPRTLPSALRHLLHLASESNDCKRISFARDTIISLLLQERVQCQFTEVKPIIPWLYHVLKNDVNKHWLHRFIENPDYMKRKGLLYEQLSDIASRMYNRYSEASEAHKMLLKKLRDHREEISGALTAAGTGEYLRDSRFVKADFMQIAHCMTSSNRASRIWWLLWTERSRFGRKGRLPGERCTIYTQQLSKTSLRILGRVHRSLRILWMQVKETLECSLTVFSRSQ